MEPDNDQQLSDSQTFKDFRDPRTDEVCLPEDMTLSELIKQEAHFSDPTYANIRKVRKPAYIKNRSRVKKMPYDHPRPFTSKAKLAFHNSDISLSGQHRTAFEKREITTIQEEVFHYKKHSKSNASFKGKAYKEKVASLKVVVGRLKEMCLAKPEVLQNKVPEEIMKLFSGIQL